MRFMLSSICVLLLFIINRKCLCLPSGKMNEGKVEDNMVQLQQYRWFHELLDDARFAPLIVHDPDVRKAIASLSQRQLQCKAYGKRSRRKIEQLIHEKSKQLV